MSLSPTNPDPTTEGTSITGSTLSPNSPPSPPSPPSHPTPNSPHPASPSSPHAFLHALIACNYNLPELAARLSPAEFLELISDTFLLKKLEALLAFSDTCLTLRQSHARHDALQELQSLLSATTDAVEKRRVATSLLRATGARSSHSSRAASTTPAEHPPRPVATPRSDLTPQQVVELLANSLRACNTPEKDSGFATLAAFADHDAEINKEPIPTDDPFEAIDAIKDTEIGTCNNADDQDIRRPTELKPDRATISVWLALRHNIATPRLLTYRLTKRPDSRHPGCWLLDSLTTGPPR